jgi:hypothetical protein
VSERKKESPGSPPQGAFSSQGGGTSGAPPSKSDPKLPSGLGVSLFPPHSGPPPGAEELVLEELAKNAKKGRRSSSFPPPLGQSEGHDAWTSERMSRQSTVPPVRTEEVDRLRELATRSSLRPEPADNEGNALDLVDRSHPSVQLDLVGEMEELYALDDLTGALRFAELVLGREPQNAQAKRCAENCRRRLLALYSSKIGSMDAVPAPLLGDAELRWLGLDHRSGFLLSRVDGISTFDEVLDVCGMPRLEALKTLVDLIERGAIRVK